MTDQMLLDAYDKLADLAVHAGEQKKYHDSLQYAIAAYEITRDDERSGVNLITLALIYEACERLLEINSAEVVKKAQESRKGKTACSFCGKKEPEVKLGAGPGVFICNECVITFSEAFKK